MLEIRCSLKEKKKIEDLYHSNKNKFSSQIINITLDQNIEQSIIMIKTEDGSLREWTRGYENVKSFLENGYVKIIQQCPFANFKKCKGEECQLYLIRNNTGDCSIKWQAILSFDKN